MKHTPGPWSRSWIAGAIRHINKNVNRDAFWQPDEALGETEEKYRNCEIRHPEKNEADYDLIAAAPEMVDALRAVLLFHDSSEWSHERREEWYRLTGSEDATTRVLCDTVRAAIDKATGKGKP